MDGVIADFYTGLARHYEVSDWTELPNKDESVKALKGTNFFAELPKFPTSNELVEFIHTLTNGKWYILSAPLRDDHEHSAAMKRKWLDKHGYTPKNAYFSSRKERYAVRENNWPNILIDDREHQLNRWVEKGGIGIRYQANQDSLDDLKTLVKSLFRFSHENRYARYIDISVTKNEKETIKT